MDTSKPVTHVSLCSGYGGIDLGLKRAVPNLRTIAVSEVEAFACANLVAKMEAGYLDAAPIWTDVKTFPWEEFRGKVDILSGGYPCQPFSAAGKRLGKDDPRHLWPWIADGIRVCRPSVCFFENVEGHISLGLREVIGELEEIGYRATWGVFSAAEVGAPHQRKRVFILAYDTSAGLERLRAYAGQPLNSEFGDRCLSIWPSRPGQQQFPWEPPRVVAHTNSGRLEGASSEQGRAKNVVGNNGESCQTNVGDTEIRENDERKSRNLGQATSGGGSSNDAVGCSSSSVGDPKRAERRPDDNRITGETDKSSSDASSPDRWQTEPTLGGDVNGSSGRLDYAQLCVSGDNRTDELRLLGNGVVPATAERAFRTLIARFFV